MTNKKSIVVDSSVAVKWLNRQNEDFLDRADKILKDAESDKVKIYSPELAKYEIGNAIVYKNMESPLAKVSLSALYALPINFITLNLEMSLETLEIAQKYLITYYDACFLSLTKRLRGFLITDNPKHQKKEIVDIKVVSLKDYH